MNVAGAAAGGSAAAAAAAIAQAVKASGVVVRMEPQDFLRIVERQEEPLVVASEGGFLGTTYHYLTSYKGLAFFTKSKRELALPGDAEVVRAEKVWMPS